MTYDADPGDRPEPGMFLRAESGRCCLIVRSRLVRSGVHPNRWALRAEVVLADEVPDGAKVIPFAWYSRCRAT